jgi:hypothetical protein
MWSMARLLSFLLLWAVLLIPASAQAHGPTRRRHQASRSTPRPVPGRQGAGAPAKPSLVALAASLAEHYWKATPCGGRVAVSAYATVPPGMESMTDGWVTFSSSLGANDLAAPASTYTACSITLARWQWPTRASIEEDWGMFCLTVVHETGHLLGHPHSLAPGSVMAPIFTSEANVPPICRAPIS